MKTIFSLLSALVLSASALAQGPQKMSYQVEIRNTSNALITSAPVGMRLSVLQGNTDGQAVYIETQTPNSNANGLVSLELGAGTIVSGNFTAIDWSNGPYFIKTESDPSGGTQYSGITTSQVLSVPCPLTSNSDNAATRAMTDNNSLFGEGVVSGIAGTDSTSGSATQNQFKRESNLSNENTNSSAADKVTLRIGQAYQGGIIFYIDESGQHGLIAAVADQSVGVQWFNPSYKYTGTSGDGLYAGAMNTKLIVRKQIADKQKGNFAAKACAEYSVIENGVLYDDWYLPSKYEMNLLYQQKRKVGEFAESYYWTSTELINRGAWLQNFSNGSQVDYSTYNATYVRAIRAF